MFRVLWGVMVAIGMFAAYLLLIAVGLIVVGWQKLTGTEKRDEVTGTDDDPN